MRRGIGRTWLRAFGWEISGGRPDTERAVVVAYPHTSNWDLLFTLAIAYALDIPVSWLGKKSLFRAPFGAADVFGNVESTPELVNVRDGRFLFNVGIDAVGVQRVDIVLNWDAELQP